MYPRSLLFVFLLSHGQHLKCAAATDNDDTELVLLPIQWNSSHSTVPLSFTAFGRRIDMLLSKNTNLLARHFEIWKRGEDDALNRLDHLLDDYSCHYIYEGSLTSAAINLCNPGKVHGFVFLENDSLEIKPLELERDNLIERHRIQVRSSSSPGDQAHVVKRHKIPGYQGDAADERSDRVSAPAQQETSSASKDGVAGKKAAEATAVSLTIELAVFVDAAAYGLLLPQLGGEESRLLDLLLAYVNNVQALYYHPSLGERIELALVRLELMERQPAELSRLDGERTALLDAFCAYSRASNPADDADPRHWDLGLYLSGLDFYALEAQGKRNPLTMGLAPVGGVCWPEFACVIAEFGVHTRLGEPYPSAGFTSVYIAAHEIAHNLGMHHDSTGNDCPKDGYIMSPSRGVQGESQWSRCSRELVAGLGKSKPCLGDRSERRPPWRLDHGSRFAERPGRSWTAKRQCEILLRDPEAFVDTIENCCQELRCRSPNRTNFYRAGPALDGTKCDAGRECRAGDCLPLRDQWEPVPPVTTVKPRPSGWSEWREGSCESGCIRGSLGYLERRRTCLGEGPCPGLAFDVQLCKDHKLCEQRPGRKRLGVEEYAGRRCREFADRLPEIDGTAPGLQAEHEVARPWMACAVFCRRTDIASYYTPRLELNELGLDPYLPDGTWCHRDAAGQNYFCRRHHCLPENFRFGKGLTATEEEAEVAGALGPMNEPALDYWHRAEELRRYFSLDELGRPLLTRLPPADGDPWTDEHDYVEIAELMRRRQAREQLPFM